MRYLVIHDVDAIQGYIFATGKLREVRGASALIDQINHRETGHLIGQYKGRRIYVGGGGAAADFAEKGAAQDFCFRVSEIYLGETFIASSTGVVEPYDESAKPEAPTSFRSALQRAHFNLRQQKVSRLRKTQVLSCPYFKLCQACGIYPSVHHDPYWPEEEGRFVCQACCAKRQVPRNPFIHQYIVRAARENYRVSISFPESLDKIGQAADPEGYIGVIYADGNRMGDHLQRLETRSELRGFSRTVDRAVKETIADVLLRRYIQGRTGDTQVPVIVPLCGGDDLVVVLPGQDALGVAVDYLKEFQQHVQATFPKEVAQRIGEEVSACAGVAIAKAHTPLASLFDLAHELCKSAKVRSYEFVHPLAGQDPQEIPCLDFQVLTTPSWRSVREVRSTEYVLDERTRLTARPYTAEEAGRLIEAVQKLKRQKFPPGKLYDLYRGLRAGRFQAVFRYLTLSMRAQESSTGYQQRNALREVARLLGVSPDLSGVALSPPWQQWPGPGRGPDWMQTPYGDLMEIYAFVPA